MANTKQDFYDWVVETYPGWWPEDLDKVDWTLPSQAKKLEAWKAAGYPAGTVAGPSGKVEGVAEGRLQPMITEGEEGAFPDDLVEFVPGRIFYSPSTKKYYAADNVGDPTTIIVTQEDALNERNRWAKAEAEGGGVGQTPQWRPGELEFQKEQFEWQKQQDLGKEQQAQGELARTYEEYRRKLLSELTDPSDWITRWMVEQTPEKHPAPTGADQEPARGRMLYDFEVIEGETLGPGDVVITDSAQTAAKLGATLWIPRKKIDDEMIVTSIRQQFQWRDEGAFAKPPTNKEIFQSARWFAAENQMGPGRGAGVGVWDITQAVNPDWVPQRGGAGSTWEQTFGQVKGTPGAPGWLPTFAPGQRAGQPISKERVAPPSGQQWMATPWSQREGLSGFAEWSGQSFTDVLNQMAMMQTRTPGGAGQARWAPRTQRTAV